jgi:hypothetical protein
VLADIYEGPRFDETADSGRHDYASQRLRRR